MIDLTIKTLDSQNHKFRVPDTFTILELKEHIAEHVNVAVLLQRLIFCGRVLSNETKLADIGVHGKVMHLVQKVPRLTTTTSGSSSSTTTNTNSRSGQNGGPGFRGWHAHDPTVVFGAIGIPSEFMHVGELPRLMGTSRTQGTGNRLSMAMDMIRRGNEVLNRLENPSASQILQPPGTDSEQPQFPEGSQQTEDTLGSVPPESSTHPTHHTDPDSVNVSYELDETFPNTVVVTIDATHHVRMPPGLMRHMHNHIHANHTHPNIHQNTTQPTVENETTVPETTPVESSNQSFVEQATGTTLPTATTEQNLRDDRQTSENRNSASLNERRRLRELIEQLNKLKSRFQPFYAMYCQFINEDPQFESSEGENGSDRAQTVFNGVSEVMHYISHVYHAISDVKVAFNRPPPRTFHSRPCLLQGTILHTAHSVPVAAATVPHSQTQQPTSTQTTNSSQSIPSVRAFRLDFMNPEATGNETPNVSTSNTNTESNTSVPADSNSESNSASLEFPPGTPHGVELMFDLTPGTGTIRIDSVEASFVSPNVSGSTQPTTVSQPSSGNEASNNLSLPMPMPIDWMDQMIDVISSGVRRPFMSDQSLDWSSIPTTSTRTPRVTPRTTDSSSTSNSSSQGMTRGRDTGGPRMDPFLPCSSHHFESHLRPMVLARRSAQGTDRSTSSANSTTNTSTPTSPNEMRPFSSRRAGRPRTRYIQDPDSFLSGIHPILTWGRNHRNNTATTSASNNAQATTGQGSGLSDPILTGHIRSGIENVFDSLEREVNLEQARRRQTFTDTPVINMDLLTNPQDLLLATVSSIPFFAGLEGQSILMDLFLLIARDWTLFDILNISITNPTSSIVQNPVSRLSNNLTAFILDRVMRNEPPNNRSIEDAANRIYQELLPYLNVIQFSVTMRSNVDFGATVLRYITLNLRELVVYCEEHRAGVSNDIVASLKIFAQGLLGLLVYCCNNRTVFRLNIGALMRFLPLPQPLHRVIMDEVRINIDKYWEAINSYQMSITSVCNYIVPTSASGSQVGQTSRGNEEQMSNTTLTSSEIPNEPLPEVVIGSQEWHHGVSPEWVPVIARDSQRQRRQGAQPPYSDAYLSGMPNKRRKIVTSSKTQGPLSQIIAKNLEVAMGAAGVTIKKEVTTSVGADTAVQNAYTERIRTFGRSGIDTHPDFCPNRYPNVSKFFYDNNHPN